MKRYPKIIWLINNIDIDKYLLYEECVKGIAKITASDEYIIPFLWEKMLSAVLKSCNVEVIYDTKQAVANWMAATCLWNANIHSPLAKEGYYPFPDFGDYYDFAFSREHGYLMNVTDPYLYKYIQAIALFNTLRFYIKEEMPKPLYDGWGRLVKNEGVLYFDEREMWEIIVECWPIHINWDFYNLRFDGKNFELCSYR